MEEIIDSSVMLNSSCGRLDVEAWLNLMRKAGIGQAVIAPPFEYAAVYNDEGNRLMIDLTAACQGVLYGLAVANPWYGKEAVSFLNEAFDGGLSGLYVNPLRQGFLLAEEILDPLMAVCAERGKPVYCHTGTPVCAMPFQLAELARRFPSVAFVMGHASWTDFCGYDVIPAARQAGNIMVDTACACGEVIRQLLSELGSGRVLFGTGFPESDPVFEVHKIQRLNLAPDVLDQLLRQNARRLWSLP